MVSLPCCAIGICRANLPTISPAQVSSLLLLTPMAIIYTIFYKEPASPDKRAQHTASPILPNHQALSNRKAAYGPTRTSLAVPHSHILVTSSTPHSPLLSPQQAEPTSFVPSYPTQMPLSPSPPIQVSYKCTSACARIPFSSVSVRTLP